MRQLEERERDIEAGRKDPLSESIPINLTFKQRLAWLDEKYKEQEEVEARRRLKREQELQELDGGDLAQPQQQETGKTRK